MTKQADTAFVVLIILVATLISAWTFDSSRSADFQALWLAGEFFQMGQLDQIYPPETEYFTTKPSAEWIAHVAAQGQETAIYSYIYPPLWAALFAPLTTITTFELVSEVAGYINPALIGAMFYLCWRLCSNAGMHGLRAWVYVAIGYAICFSTTIGLIGLAENQIQILVSFLILLALERERANAPVVAGLAMGLAAAIKLYPVFLVVFWLAQGKWRPTVIATAFGCALGLVSISLTGWELHAVFLEKLAMISNSIFLNGLNYALETGIANLFFNDQLIFSFSAAAELSDNDYGGQHAMAKPVIWQVLSKVAVFLSIVGLALLAYRYRRETPIAFWPTALGVVSLLTPLAWGYHYLPAVSFAPALFAYLGLRTGTRQFAIVFVPLMLGLTPVWKLISPTINGIQLVGLIALIVYVATWAYVLQRNLKPIRLQTEPTISPKTQAQ